MRTRLRHIAAVAAAVMGGVYAQSTKPPLTFEVASIKPNATDDHRVSIQIQPGGGLRATGVSLKFLITFAYDVREFQVSGGPGWMDSDRYDIMAKSEGSADSDSSQTEFRKMSEEQRKTALEQLREKMKALLADRFDLKIHNETKEESVYALVVGKNGSKLKPSDSKNGPGPRLRFGRGELSGQGVSMEMLTKTLANPLGRPVIDKTGLTGNFDFTLQWTPEPGQGGGPFGGGAPPPGAEGPPPSDSNSPSIFTAVQEQLGLKLESQKGPVDMLVIDQVKKPSEN